MNLSSPSVEQLRISKILGDDIRKDCTHFQDVERTHCLGWEIPRQNTRWVNSNTASKPWKINMEPTIHPFRKETDLPKLPWLCSMLIFRGVTNLQIPPICLWLLRRDFVKFSHTKPPEIRSHHAAIQLIPLLIKIHGSIWTVAKKH